MPGEKSFASRSVPIHLARGVIGFGLLVGSIALAPVTLFSLLLAPAGVVALRGCPTCWAIGLAQTISRRRLQRSCTDGRCQLTPRRDTMWASLAIPGSGNRAGAPAVAVGEPGLAAGDLQGVCEKEVSAHRLAATHGHVATEG